MKTTFRLLAIASILVAFGWAVNAQSLATFVFPANNATGIPIGDSIIITTHWKIDTSCLVAHAGDTLEDTEISNVFVVSKYVHDSISDTLWGSMSSRPKVSQCPSANGVTNKQI
jgi:hypothetical protein